MGKFLKIVSIYGIGVFLLLNLISFLCLYSLERSFFYKQQFVKNGLTESSFDYVVLGSSTGLTTLDSKQIDSITGLNGLNISMDDSALSSHYLMLQQFYSFGYQTKELVLCVTPDDMSNINPTINGNDYRFLPHANDASVKKYFSEMDGDNKWVYQLTSYIPAVGVSYFNSELFFPGILAILKPQKRNLFDERGNYSYPINKSASKQLKINEKKIKNVVVQNPYFFRIVDFCNQNKIKLMIYQSPVYNLKIMYDSKLSIINHSSLFDDGFMFYDKIHVNKIGRKTCSQEMAAYFLENSNLEK